MDKKKFSSIDEYIASFNGVHKKKLEELRTIINKAAAKKAVEVISYNMPAIKLNKILVYYAAAAKHIGLYPAPRAIQFFAKELDAYPTSKGAIQFPVDQALPAMLIKKIVQYRIIEDQEKAELQK